MEGCRERVYNAFAHQPPDRTPLFGIFTPHHPLHWDICGHNIATDAAMCWDAMAEGVSWEELVEAEAQARFKMARFFGVDIVHIVKNRPRAFRRPVKKGKGKWLSDGVEYTVNEKTKLVVKAHPSDRDADSSKISEKERRREVEEWDGTFAEIPDEELAVFRRIRELAKQEGQDWVYMTEMGCGTGVAFYPPFQLMWLISEPELLRRWIRMQAVRGFHATEVMIHEGCEIVALGGDVSCDKGPFISPAHYHEFILPAIQEHVNLVHRNKAFAVYTSDGNHWAIKDDLFFNSDIDGYKEVDKAAGMTWARLIEEKIDEKICIIGNVDARYILCQGTTEEVRDEVVQCLKLGQKSPGGHILHSSHSVHEDVKVENYYAMVNAYREFFGMEPLP